MYQTLFFCAWCLGDKPHFDIVANEPVEFQCTEWLYHNLQYVLITSSVYKSSDNKMDSNNTSFSGRIKFACKSLINPHREHKVAVLCGSATAQAQALRAEGYANAVCGLPRYVPNRTTSSNFHFVPGYFIYIDHKACARAAIAFITEAMSSEMCAS